MKNDIPRILVVDDDKDIANLIKISLEHEGYVTDALYDGQSALEQIRKKEYDLAILDVMMPHMDGFTLCSEIRKEFFFPVLMVTAKGTDMDKITGLLMGADDYIVKPFNPMEVVMRVKAQLRRCQEYSQGTQREKNRDKGHFELRGLLVDHDTRTCILVDERLELTPIEFNIMLYLCERMGNVVSSEELFEAVWKEKYLENNNTVAAHITRLREKMHEVPRHPKYIKTVWGVGYKID